MINDDEKLEIDHNIPDDEEAGDSSLTLTSECFEPIKEDVLDWHFWCNFFSCRCLLLDAENTMSQN